MSDCNQVETKFTARPVNGVIATSFPSQASLRVMAKSFVEIVSCLNVCAETEIKPELQMF
jgi:hypothetical protein